MSRRHQMISLPTPEIRETLSLIGSCTTSDPDLLASRIPSALEQIDRAVVAGDPKILARWATSAARTLDSQDVCNLIYAGCNAYAKVWAKRYGRTDLSKVVGFLLSARHHVADAVLARDSALAATA
jgi:hypothetical protein